MSGFYKIALAGNPNGGKSSLFNALTGLRQKVGNYPGVTVDKKVGRTTLKTELDTYVIDLPGTYSLSPKTADEQVACEILLDPSRPERPELVVVVVDASNLKRNLLFCSQILDLGLPVVVALTMVDIAREKGISIDVDLLTSQLGVPVVKINPLKGKGISKLKKVLAQVLEKPAAANEPFVPLPEQVLPFIHQLKESLDASSDFAALCLALNQGSDLAGPLADNPHLKALSKDRSFKKSKLQAENVLLRYAKIDAMLALSVTVGAPTRRSSLTDRIDKVLLHKTAGTLVAGLVLVLMFQIIFWLASFPMDWIEQGFAWGQELLARHLPGAWWSDLLVNGLLAGIGGVVVFVPQIALLFGIITLLEDSGYMARMSFLSDRLMRAVGLNGKSVMPMISGLACAIPAIMATRTIENRKERLITILVTPLMSCSARLPIYIILISLVIPDKTYGGFLKLQGLVMAALYLLGFATTLIVAAIANRLIKSKRGEGYFFMELPDYRMPRWKNAWTTMLQKSGVFVKQAGKVILIISLVLWAFASYGPPEKMYAVDRHFMEMEQKQNAPLSQEQEDQRAALRLENSYAGLLGKTIEPLIRPLGYDWKIGIALISSFAAREVFVGTMATLYSVGSSDEDGKMLREKMAAAKRPDGSPIYTLATGISLMVFYAFAMQCMSTMAIVRRETGTWKWALVQFAYMGLLAYVAAWVAYRIFL